jgi:hypothetical protein
MTAGLATSSKMTGKKSLLLGGATKMKRMGIQFG